MFDVSRQSYYKYKKKIDGISEIENKVLSEVLKLRSDHPKMGGRKLYHMLKPMLKNLSINIGRDKFYDILSKYNLLIKRRIRKVRTTYSDHWYRKYPNIIKEIEVVRPDEIWVSDITYWRIGGVFIYVALVTDSYSRKIVGYSVSEQMRTIDILPSLKMALNDAIRPLKDLIHHSDRGCQYCSKEYVGVLESRGVQISMTESGDPLDNPLAERMNGILKIEYLKNVQVRNISEAKHVLSKSVHLYNNSRPHLSCGLHTPSEVYEGKYLAEKVWKNYYKSANCKPISG